LWKAWATASDTIAEIVMRRSSFVVGELAVVPTNVVLHQLAEASCGRSVAERAVWSSEVVALEPGDEPGGSLEGYPS
jgi:hypothetical protein